MPDLYIPIMSATTFEIDVQDGGRFRIAGTVSELGVPNVPVARRVNLIEEISGRVIREGWSDAATGAYKFDEIAGGRFYSVVAFDHTGLYRAVIADKLTPEPMP